MNNKNLSAADHLWNELIDRELFTPSELILAISLNGFTVETLNNCLFVRYGYRDLNQMLEEEEA